MKMKHKTDNRTDPYKLWCDSNPIKLARAKKGWSRREFIARHGLTSKSVQNWEGGVDRPSPTNLVRLSAILGQDIASEMTVWFDSRPQF